MATATKRAAAWATPAEAAEYLGFAVGTLANWRSQGKGPKFHKTSDDPRADVRYDYADLDAWMRRTSP